jgi:hypothetical protein
MNINYLLDFALTARVAQPAISNESKGIAIVRNQIGSHAHEHKTVGSRLADSRVPAAGVVCFAAAANVCFTEDGPKT